MNDLLQQVVQVLEDRFKAEPVEFRGQTTLLILPENIVEAARTLRDEFDFEMLEDLTAVDYWPDGDPRFNVVYQLYSVEQNQKISLRVPVGGLTPSVPTVEGVYSGANWYEREIWDMFGIQFAGHSDMRRILMPADWVGHPLRKDYPTGYEEVAFTFNIEEIDLRKPHGTEE